MQWNNYQTTLEELHLDEEPQEIQDQFFDFINNVPYIRSLISKDRPRACDLPRDEQGRIIVDIANPHILEDMDYFRPAAIEYKKTGKYTQLRPNPNPNSEYGKWIREELRRCYEGYVRPFDGEWITGNMYFFLNYCPITMTRMVKGSKRGERVIDFPEVWEGIYYRFHYIEQARKGGIYCEEGGKNGSEVSSRGKAHPDSQIVYTPKGKTTWGNIKIGDTLYGDDGYTTTVVDIPYSGYEDIYKITLKDGREVFASGNHLWKVWRSYSHCYKTLSTLEMMKDFVKPKKVSERNPKGEEFIYRIPNHKGVEWEHKNIPVDAYTFGLLLGDGSFRSKSCCFTQAPEDFMEEKKYIPYKFTKWKGYLQYKLHIPKWSYILKEYGLFYKKSENKFIPEDYKYNDRTTRINILRGLMDSDGFVDSNGIPIIGVSSKQLADDIAFIARSLGYNCLQSVKKAGYKTNGTYKKCLDNYVVRIYTNDDIFRLKRKQSLVTKFTSKYSKSNRDFSAIVNIEYSHKEKCHCVTVDNESDGYLIGDFITTHNSKSFTMAAIMAKYFVLGESGDVNKAVKSMATAYQKQYLTSDGILNKFQSYIDFLAVNTQFPNKRLKSSLQDMAWKMGYVDLDTGTQKGTLNEVIGVSAKDDPAKVRGKRMNFICVEEFGSFKNILDTYNVMLPSVREGDISFGFLYLIGTAGDSESDFQGAQEIIYNPEGYYMYPLPNVFDKEGQGKSKITFFFPGYLNRKGCYDEDGNSDVTKALLEILKDRHLVKYNSSDPNTITKTIAEIPIVPQEALLRTRGNLFPVTDLNIRLNEIDSNPSFYDDVYTGQLISKSDGTIDFMPSADIPIREFPLRNQNNVNGAFEIYSMPEKNSSGKIPNDRYIAGLDPIDDDQSDGNHSLMSFYILDLWTDQLVAVYTGRHPYADDCFEEVRKGCLFYNARCLYENNKKGIFAYFSRLNCLYLLADTPEYLRDKELIKYTAFGNRAKGYNATLAINNYANTLIRDWMIKPITEIKTMDGEQQEVTVMNLHKIKDRALIKEAILFNADGNFDRIRALGALMLYREEKIILYQGNMKRDEDKIAADYLGNDPFFRTNYDERLIKFGKC